MVVRTTPQIPGREDLLDPDGCLRGETLNRRILSSVGLQIPLSETDGAFRPPG